RRAAPRRAGNRGGRRRTRRKPPARPGARSRYRTLSGFLAAVASSFQVGEFAKDLKALVNLFAAQGLQPLRAKTFHGKRAHDPAVEQSPLQDFAAQLFLRRQIAHESAGKGIARSGGIFHLIERQRSPPKRMPPRPKGASAKEVRGPYSPGLVPRPCRPNAKPF